VPITHELSKRITPNKQKLVFHGLHHPYSIQKLRKQTKKENTKKLLEVAVRRRKAQCINVSFWSSYGELRKTPICHDSPKSAKPPTERSEKGNPKECKITPKKNGKETSILKKNHKSKRAEDGTKNRWVGTYLPTASKMRDENRGRKERNLVELEIAGVWRTGTS
jgi:hypothetical protein